MERGTKVQVLVRLAPDAADTLNELAEEQARTKSDVIDRLLFREKISREQAEGAWR